MTKIVWLQHRVADDPSGGLAEPPDALAGDGPPDLALPALAQLDQKSGVPGVMLSVSVGRCCLT